MIVDMYIIYQLMYIDIYNLYIILYSQYNNKKQQMLQIDQDDILVLIAKYFNSIGENKLATKVQSKILTHHEKRDSPLLKKKLDKIVRHYVSAHEKLLDYYIEKAGKNEKSESEDEQEIVNQKIKLNGNKRNRQEEQEEDNQIVDKVDKKRKKSNHSEVLVKNNTIEVPKVLNEKQKLRQQVFKGFTSPKLLETTVVDKIEIVQFNEEKAQSKKNKHKKIEEEEIIQQQSEVLVSEKKKKKKNKLKKTEEQKEQIDVQMEEVEQQIKVSKKKDKKKSKKKQFIEQQIQQQQQEKVEEVQVEQQSQVNKIQQQPKAVKQIVKKIYTPAEQVNQQKNNHQPFFFSRVKKEQIGELPEELRDNSFNAKFKFGGGDEWGKYGYEKLKNVRGDGFKKQKGKLKNRAFQASGIDINQINSIKL